MAKNVFFEVTVTLTFDLVPPKSHQFILKYKKTAKHEEILSNPKTPMPPGQGYICWMG